MKAKPGFNEKDFRKKFKLWENGEVGLKHFTSDERAELLETGYITQEQFIELMPEKLQEYWRAISELLSKKRVFRNTDAATALPLGLKGRYQRLNMSRGILMKFKEWGMLETIRIGAHNVYFSTAPGFYTQDEILKLIPKEYQKNVLQLFADDWTSIQEVANLLNLSSRFLEEILDAFVKRGLLVKGKGGYRRSQALKEAGVSVESLEALDLVQAHNLLMQEKERKAATQKITSLKEIKEVVERDIRHKSVKMLQEEINEESARLSFIGEVRFGNQFVDVELVEWAINILKEYFKPHVIIASDFVQGDFRGIQVERLRSLTRTGLQRIEQQYSAANLLLKELEKIAKNKVVYLLSDDDWQVSLSRVIIALEQFRGIRGLGIGSRWPEEIKRLSGADYYRLMKIQWETVQPYMYRIGRSLLNADEVKKVIGDHITELLVIIFILLFEEFNKPIPEKYKKLVDVEALHSDKPGSKRIISPDPINLYLKNIQKRILAQHNIAFSDITQYVDSGLIPEWILRNLQARGRETPYIWVDFHQERFWGTKLYNTFIFNLPGCQNPLPAAEGKIKTFHTKILSDKAHRQIYFRKEPPTPGVVNFEIFKDGRLRIHVLNNKIKDVIEKEKDEPEKKDLLAYTSDWQFGSLTMRPEWVIKFLDYALFSRRATNLALNGDLIQGFHYPRFVSENRPKRLVSVSSQKAFTTTLLKPFFPAPNLETIDVLLGNHEWEIWGADITGQNNLEFIFFVLKEIYENQKLFKADLKVPDIKIWNRVRIVKTAGRHGSTINHPYGSRVLKSNYKIAIQHQWYPRGGGRTPMHSQITWLRNIAQAASDLHVLFGGHKHTFWIAMIAEILMLQLPGLNDQSAFEFARGLMPQSMGCLVEFSNKSGVTIELIPVEFLEEYKCISPFYKEIDEKGLLDRPKPGSVEYRYGLDSPFIHQLEEQIDAEYPEV
ncbi:MAG: hypothetical protein N2692_01985 [Patescibacteria group bacterium]|jgi:DNA-binding IscR family transcriptional regulator|nr:hypothetical protein [Patescibacteria group bacterium]